MGTPGETVDDALDVLALSTHAHPNGWDGSGIGIAVSDTGRPNRSVGCINMNNLFISPDSMSQDYTAGRDHATRMVCLIQAAAPGASVKYQHVQGSCGSNLRSDVLSGNTMISSQSYYWQYGDSEYRQCDADLDDMVVDTDLAHFNCTGNEGNKVASGAIGYNVISIGNYRIDTDAMDSKSNHEDPETGARKPDFAAPGGGLTVGSYTTGGTSSATALAAGFAADLLERKSFLRYQPALLKAYLGANSTRVDGTSVHGMEDGFGLLDFATAAYGAWYWWSGSNSSHFISDSDGDGRKEIVDYRSLTGGQKYRIVLSWLVDGNYVATNLKPNMDLDLIVEAPNGQEYSSISTDQNFEVVEFVAPDSGSYKLRIERWWNSGTGDVRVGLVVRAR